MQPFLLERSICAAALLAPAVPGVHAGATLKPCRERLMKATEMIEEWKEQVKLEELQRDIQEHNVKRLTQLLMERD